ncbi:hypothetical protein BGY98DRAFT_986055, partial [Russula aff. rugulosa BPL654]
IFPCLNYHLIPLVTMSALRAQDVPHPSSTMTATTKYRCQPLITDNTTVHPQPRPHLQFQFQLQ